MQEHRPPRTRRRRGGYRATLVLLFAGAVGLFALAPSDALAESPRSVGEVEPITFASPSVGKRRVKAMVYLPAGYQTSGERYPVLYALHGLGGHGRDWFDSKKGNLEGKLDGLIAAGVIPPMIVVAPDGGNQYWTNHLGAEKRRFGDLVSVDLVRHIEATYRVRAERSGRALVGISAGGHGAVSIALRHTDDYCAVVSLGGALFREAPTHRKIYRRVWGEPGPGNDGTHWRATSPVALVASASPETRWPAVFLSAGRDDNKGKAKFVELARAFSAQLTARGVRHEMVEAEGGHQWSAWMEPVDQWLAFIGKSFQTPDAVAPEPAGPTGNLDARPAPAP